MQATARDYLLKPIHVAELRAFIERTIVRDLHGVIPEHAASQPELDPVLQVEYSKFSKITNKIILIVKSNYCSSQSLTNIAEIFNMSSKYIGRIFFKGHGNQIFRIPHCLPHDSGPAAYRKHPGENLCHRQHGGILPTE